MKFNLSKGEVIFVTTISVLIIILLMIPTGFEKSIYKDSVRVKGLILNVDNAMVHQTGMIKQGDQHLNIRVLNGPFKGKEFQAVNHLKGQMEFDKLEEVNPILGPLGNTPWFCPVRQEKVLW